MSITDGINIPKHKLVKIKGKDNKSMVDANLIFDDDLSFKLSSSFGSLWEAHSNNLLTLIFPTQ